jgi:hypothetical protein
MAAALLKLFRTLCQAAPDQDRHYLYLTDQAGSVIQTVDSSENVVNQCDYDAFGNVRRET